MCTSGIETRAIVSNVAGMKVKRYKTDVISLQKRTPGGKRGYKGFTLERSSFFPIGKFEDSCSKH